MNFWKSASSVLLAICVAASVQAAHVVFDGGYQNGWSGPETVSFDGSVCIGASGAEWSWHHISNSSGVDLTGLGYFEYETYFDSAGGGNSVEWHVIAPDGKEWDITYQFMSPLEIDGAPSSYPHSMTTDAWHIVRLDCSAQSWWPTDCGSIRYIKWQWPQSCTVYIRKVRFVQSGNHAPSVDAGENQTITSPVCEVVLNGSVADDGLPDPPAAVSSTWSMVSGGAAVAFGDVSAPTTTATFSAVGTYQLRLTASDGESTGSDTVTVTLEDFSADLNSDGVVDLGDLACVAQQWLQAGGTPSADIHPAPTPDGIVNLPDYAKMASHWSAVAEEQYLDGWRMAGANPQRTSWVTENVPGKLYLDWYKPFEAYISHKTQIVAANGLLYVSTARGLYAIDAETGSEQWVYPTDLPIGHSPTVVGGVAYIGCFDRRIHAVDAITGEGIWTSSAAGAGFEVNPLVVGGKVVAGSRDGTLYCFDAATGATEWTHPTDANQPILFSCAYKDGIVYFACMDMCAYAVNLATGSRVWKSAKLPGAGFYSWWPVIHNDYVVILGSSNYRVHGTPSSAPMVDLEEQDIYVGTDETRSGYAGAVINPEPALKLDLSKASPEGNGPVTEYFRNKPWRRTYFLLNRTDGGEVMYDFNGDSTYDEYAPMCYFGTHSGNRFPPAVGADNYQYLMTGPIEGQPWISRGGICRWELGRPEIDLMLKFAHDEPSAIAMGGDHIHYFHSEWDDGSQGSVYTVARNNNQFYWYIYNIEPNIPDHYWSRTNDMCGNGADQNPGIPYNGKVYNHRYGQVLCWSGNENKTKLSEVAAEPLVGGVPVPSAAELESRLAEEVQKMLDAGHLRTGWLNRGLSGVNANQFVTDNFDDYFHEPGLTIEVLIRALPHLPQDMQQATGDYITGEFTAYPPDVYAHIGWQGAARQIQDLPPEMVGDVNSAGPRQYVSDRVQQFYSFPPQCNYTLYKYAQAFGNAGDLVGRLRSFNVPSDADLIANPWIHNCFIASFAGTVKLKQLAGQTDPSAQAELDRLMQLRANNFQIDRPSEGAVELTISRNFMYMTPELADYLHQNIQAAVEAAWQEYNYIHPFWFVSRACEAGRCGPLPMGGENGICPLWDYHALFQAKAQILQESYEDLVKYLDVPAYWRGDLYYIDNLCAALEAAE